MHAPEAANRDAKKWDPFIMAELRGKTVGFVGWGHIAKTSARLCEAFGMRIVACRRSAADPSEEPRPEVTRVPAPARVGVPGARRGKTRLGARRGRAVLE